MSVKHILHQTSFYTVRARKADGSEVAFTMLAHIGSAVELRYWQGGGILQTVLREMVRI
jgi:aconitase A